MDFETEVGAILHLRVATWTDPRERVQIGFAAEVRDCDSLLLLARTPEQKAEDDRQMERYFDPDHAPIDNWSRRRRPDPNYGSQRMFHIKGDLPAPLVEGDAWEVEVLQCTFNPSEPLTKGRYPLRKIRYTVRPIKRVEEYSRRIDLQGKVIVVERRCGLNIVRQETPFDVRRARYRLDEGSSFIEVDQFFADGASLGHYEYPYGGVGTTSDLFREHQRKFKITPDAKRLKREIRELPLAPEDLRKKFGFA